MNMMRSYESNPVLAAIDERMTITNPDFDFQIPSMANVANGGEHLQAPLLNRRRRKLKMLMWQSRIQLPK